MTRTLVLPVLMFLGLAACDKVPLTAPTDSQITLSVSQTTVPVNGTIDVIAAVIEAGGTAVHDGTTVTFTGGLGTFAPLEAQTIGGLARSVFRGTTSGTVKIGAFSGGAKAEEVEVKVGAAAAGSVSLQVVPASVGQNGGSVSVTALVLDTDGNALRGVPVVFSTDFGTLSNANVISDANGYATTNLITTRQATVTARAGTITSAVFTVTVSTAPTVTIAPAAGSTPTVGVPVAFTVTLPAPGAGTSPVQSVFIDFGDGQTQTLGAITGSVGVTHTYNTPGGYTISARATDINGGVGVSSTSIVVVRQQLPTVTLTAPATTTVALPISITFTATPPGSAQIVSARVTLQDGTVIYSGTNANSFNYKFGAAGTYTLTGVVTDSNGNSATASTTVFVNP